MKTKKKVDLHTVFPLKKVIVPVVFFSLLGCVLYISVFGNKGLLHKIGLEQQHVELEAANERIRAENQKIKEEIDLLINQPAYIEDIARRELGLVKTGEIIYYNSGG